MKKTLLTTILAAMALFGCTKSELVEPPVQGEQDAIVFGSYLGDNAQTRASVITTETLGVDGFGVNAYYTGQKSMNDFLADNTSDAGVFTAPDASKFMQNTKITYNKDKGVWEYSPLKYWPNNVDDKVSFFAYGPHAKGGNENGIVLNGTDITFTVDNEVKKQVDLIYHNQATNSTIDETKPAVGSKVEFKFDHALSRIAFTVEAAVDEVISNGTHLLDGNTRINVKKVALVSSTYNDTEDENGDVTQEGPFYTEGTLHLNHSVGEDATGNKVPENLWTIASDVKTQAFEFNATNHFYHTVVDKCAETGDNVNVVQLTRYNASEPQRLLNDESYLMIIPQKDVKFSIYIEYDVISVGNDNTVAGDYDGSAITNKITTAVKDITFEKGKAYNFNLVLGMTSVKIDAKVSDWVDATDYEDEVWLPENIPFATKEIDGETWFLIQSAEDLALFRTYNNTKEVYIDKDGVEQPYYSAKYLQTKDIDLKSVLTSELGWDPVGTGGDDGDVVHMFEGVYDGQNYTVSNMEQRGSYMSGLFYKTSGATIKNVKVNGTITDAAAFSVGGVVGHPQNNTQVINCHFTGSISTKSGSYAGGISGDAASATIVGCSNGGDITSALSQVGGIAGLAGTVQACYNYGTLTGSNSSMKLGGVIGMLGGGSENVVIGCYNSGIVEFAENSGTSIGEIVGDASASSTISYCYYNGTNAAVGGNSSVDLTDHVGTASDWKDAMDNMNNGLKDNNVSYHYVESTVENPPLVLKDGSADVVAPAQDQLVPTNLVYDSHEQSILIRDAADLEEAGEYINAGDPYKIGEQEDNSEYHKVYRVIPAGGGTKSSDAYSYFKEALYIQTADIDLSGHTKWVPIGTEENSFGGSYSVYSNDDGNYYSISNLCITEVVGDYAGLFGNMGSTARISGIRMINVNIGTAEDPVSAEYAAAIAGHGGAADFNYCSVESGYIHGKKVAGISAEAWNSSFTNCKNGATIKGSGDAAGIYAHNNGTISGCENTGAITSTAGSAAGIAIAVSNVEYVKNSGNISGYGDTGGIVAGIYSKDATITASINSGTIKSENGNAGGIVGYSYRITLTACYNASDNIKGKNAGGIIGMCIVGGSDSQDEASMISNYSLTHDVIANEVEGGDVEKGTAGAICGRVDLNGGSTITYKDCYYLSYSGSPVGNVEIKEVVGITPIESSDKGEVAGIMNENIKSLYWQYFHQDGEIVLGPVVAGE